MESLLTSVVPAEARFQFNSTWRLESHQETDPTLKQRREPAFIPLRWSPLTEICLGWYGELPSDQGDFCLAEDWFQSGGGCELLPDDENSIGGVGALPAKSIQVGH